MRLSHYANGRDNNFNLIRLLAAFAVLFSHSVAILGLPPEREIFFDRLGVSLAEMAVDVFFVTSGFDKNVNIFSADDWALVQTLSGHSGNVLSVDASMDGRWIASCGHDRTVKLWGRNDGAGI